MIDGWESKRRLRVLTETVFSLSFFGTVPVQQLIPGDPLHVRFLVSQVEFAAVEEDGKGEGLELISGVVDPSELWSISVSEGSEL